MNANDDYGSIVVAYCSIFSFTDNAPVERRVPKSIRLSSCEKPAFLRCSRVGGCKKDVKRISLRTHAAVYKEERFLLI